MYIPSAHRLDDPELIIELMNQNSFATLITVAEGIPVATHLPILVEPGEPIILCGHIARQNLQWKAFAQRSESLVIFSGPHGYVSPRFYESRPNVPTWNYVSIHAYGTVDIIDDDDEALDHLERMVSFFDPTLAETQPESMDREFLRKLLPGIVAFRLKVGRLDAKAKLNQNKSQIDHDAVRDRYLVSSDLDEQKMGRLMEEDR